MVQGICDGGDAGKPVALNPDSVTGAAFMALAAATVKAVDGLQEGAKRVRINKQ